MSQWRWILHDPSGRDLRSTETFSSRADAEAWMGAEWASLLQEGAESVSLVEDGKTLYRMGLTEK